MIDEEGNGFQIAIGTEIDAMRAGTGQVSVGHRTR